MSRARRQRRTSAVVLLAVALALVSIPFASAANAGVPPTSESSTTTTAQPSTTTTTTEPSTTTTAARPSTTQARPSSTTTTTSPRRASPGGEEPGAIVTESTTTLPPSTTTTAAPEIITDDTLPPRTAASESGGLSTDTKLALVVGALVVVGIMIGVLTFLYWRHTRPQRYMTALDALADVEQKVPRRPDDVPTAEHAVVTPGAGTAGAVGAGTGATAAVRILEPDVAKDAPSGAEAPEQDDAPTATTPSVPDDAVFDEPTVITTLEDLRNEGGDGSINGGDSSR